MSSYFKNLFSFPSDKRARRKSEFASGTSSCEENHSKNRRHSVPEPSSYKSVQTILEPIHEVDLLLIYSFQKLLSQNWLN